MKSYKISEIIYWCIAIVSIVEVFLTWDSNLKRAYIFFGFAIISILMALFRRYYRNKFISQKKSIIYGSVEKNDYNKIIGIINSRQDLKHIIVPHEINSKILKNIQKKLSSNYILYSNINDASKTQANILIVDKFGILKYLYKYSEIAYVGGGFDNGIHNTLEPVVYGNFVMFGPKHENFKEASWLIEKQIGKSIKNEIEFQKEVNDFLNKKQSKSDIIKIILPVLKAKKQNLNLIINEIQNKK